MCARPVLQSNLPSRRHARTHYSARELVPAIRRLEYVFFHCDPEAVTVVFGRRDGRFVLAAVFDPGFEFLIPSVGADTVYWYR